ncbi:MAG: 1-deoxy-D-xylulose-5-phosphate reductoisomerase [Dehalococcoidia bacterium]|nr:1-deoxy-D-xylulose-5-phosphate reductoisomerase [Dehalococcoidia bacterium]
MKRIAVLGSTGSVGRQTLEVAKSFPDRLKIVAITGGRNSALLSQQIEQLTPRAYYSLAPIDFSPGFANTGIYRAASLEEIATLDDVDIIVVATSGKAGLLPTIGALQAGKTVAIANKEVLVMAGGLVMEAAVTGGGTVLPIDSEHNALWQCLRGESIDSEWKGQVSRLVITASGGAFRDYQIDKLSEVTPEEALRHPTWQMGVKITVDSATLMNKGLEVIEAAWLFNLPLDKIDVILHRESIVHSLVEMKDGSLKVLLSCPDMHLPIKYALSYPERWEDESMPVLELDRIGSLAFGELDSSRYPCFRLALSVAKKGGTYPAALIGADDAAVQLFLEGHITYLKIPQLIEEVIQAHINTANPTIHDVLEAEEWGRKYVQRSLDG